MLCCAPHRLAATCLIPIHPHRSDHCLGPSTAGNGQSTAQLAFDGAILDQEGAALPNAVASTASITDGFTKLSERLPLFAQAHGVELCLRSCARAPSGAILGTSGPSTLATQPAIVCFAFIGAVNLVHRCAHCRPRCALVITLHTRCNLAVPTVTHYRLARRACGTMARKKPATISN